MILKTDCINFPGDRPCIYNKMQGIMCNNCSYYSAPSFRILIIKLDAAGDVLRTTSLLPALKRKYPDSHITWITRKESAMLFENNHLVDSVLFVQDESLVPTLLAQKFNLLIHPDASPVSASIASIVNAEVKKGYILGQGGNVAPVNSEAEEWLEMGAFDQVKKANEKTYQQIIHEIAGLEYAKDEIILCLNEEEKNFAQAFYKKYNLSKYKVLVGLNTGSSKRWPLKQWPIDKYIQLIEQLTISGKTGVLLFGGPDEAEKNRELKIKYPEVIDTGANNSLREFFALLSLADEVVTGDTLALHASAALKKNVICLFGPTSSNEIEDYGRITKVIPDMECLVCYKTSCIFVPNCMDLITVDMVLKEHYKNYPK